MCVAVWNLNREEEEVTFQRDEEDSRQSSEDERRLEVGVSR